MKGKRWSSLQGIDAQGRVIYMGTFSRTIFSALRIGYLVVPRSLVPVFTAAKWMSDRHMATLEQQTLADFIAAGMYERHLRNIRRRSAARHTAQLDAIDKHLSGRVEVTGAGAGAHVVLWPHHQRCSEEAIVSRAASAGVRVYGISRYFLKTQSRAGLLLGYARLGEQAIKEGIRRLAEAL